MGNNVLPQAKASRIEQDGALRRIPGLTLGEYYADQPVFFIHSGLLNLHTATTASGYALIPFPASIISVQLALTEQAGTGPALVLAGHVGDLDAYVDDYSVATADAVGLYDLTEEDAFVNAVIDAGDVVVFSTDGGATTTGTAFMTLICVPNR